ncbi:hydroxyacid dehydrogenase [soil metagenome]
MLSSVLVGENRFVGKVYTSETIDRIRKHSRLVEPSFDAGETKAHERLLAEAEVIFGTWGMPILDDEFLELTPKLQAVFYAAGTVKHWVTDATWQRGITICSAWRANAVPVAEFTLGAILLSLKNVWAYHRALHTTRDWDLKIPTNGGYHGTVGLVSLGAVGMRVADLLSNFDLDVIAYDPVIDPRLMHGKSASLVGLDELFERSDVISIHSPLLPETEGSITGQLVGLMKPYSTLINTARGAVLHEDQVIEVLRRRPDLTAFLDVTRDEPPSIDSPLFELPNVLLTPHVSGSLGSECQRMGNFMFGEYMRYLRNQPLTHQVTRDMLNSMA